MWKVFVRRMKRQAALILAAAAVLLEVPKGVSTQDLTKKAASSEAD
jgi:hypothetical protein